MGLEVEIQAERRAQREFIRSHYILTDFQQQADQCDRITLQEEAQQKCAGLEAEIQAERRAQRDLKLVLAAAEQQAQHDSNERREMAVRWGNHF